MQKTGKSKAGFLPLLLAVCAAVLILLSSLTSAPQSLAAGTQAYRDLSTNEDRLALIASFGWEVEPTPAEIAEVTIPREFDEVYEAYNELQKPLGCDLFSRRGRTVRRYTYVVKNHPDEGTVYANLLFSANEFIGGDISSASPTGFVECLKQGV